MVSKFVTLYKAGEVICQKGQPQTDFFIINSGRLQVKNGNDSLFLITLGKGDFFGEESLLSNPVSPVTVEVIEDANLIRIPNNSLAEMIKQNTEIALKVLKKLSEKHFRIEEALLEKIAKPVPRPEQVDEEGTSPEIAAKINAYLVIQRSNRIVQLKKTLTVLGRRDYTTGFIPDVDLTEEDQEKYISRKHAQIQYLDHRFYFAEETGAINGTFLNGKKIQPGVKHEIKNGDELTLCHLNITFRV